MSRPLRRAFDLSATKRALFERLLRESGTEASPGPSSPSREVGAPVPLSFAQQRLWFLAQLEPDSPLYHVSKAMRIRGPLRVAALRQALEAIVARHEVLRTTYGLVDGSPVQVIADDSSVDLPVIHLDAAAGEAEMRRRLVAVIRRPFDLARERPLRASVLRLDDEDHALLLVMHHIASDGWSLSVLFREMAVLYEAFCGGHPSPLPPLPLQYADYALWQRQRLQGAVLAQQLSYWKQHLAGIPAVLELPTDRPRPAVQTYRGARQAFAFPASLSRELNALSRTQGVTLFMTLLAAFQTLLHRYTGQTDIAVGSPIAGRTRSDTEELIGFFVNTLVLRTDLSGDPPFRELLGRVREIALAAYTNQELPFERLVEELQPTRSLSHSPLFQVMFALQNTPQAAPELPGLALTPLEESAGVAKFALTLTVWDTPEGLRGTAEYATDLFDTPTISRMLGHYEVLLQGVVADSTRRVSALPLLTPAERHQLLVTWNRPGAAYPADRCLHELLEAQVERTPDAVAVVCEDRQLTYAELNHRGNQLAHHLRALGVRPGVLVAICVERSLEMVVGVLGILKAGGTYVPLDPAYPAERLAFMIDDARVPVLLTQEALLARTPRQSTHVVCLDADWETIARHGDENPNVGATPDDLAYMMYTSGSTGTPKGVTISHDNVVRLFRGTHDWFRFDERDVWSLFHSYAFDFSVWELWGALLHGGRLVIVPLWVSRSPEAFYALLHKERVTVLNQTPSAFRQLVQAEDQTPDRAGELALRLVIFGGEALEVGSLKSWLERHGDERPRLVNMYGITETTVHVTYRPITSNDLGGAEGSPIGVPIPDLEVYLLDAHRNPVPIGIPGEIYVGGAGLARGYFNRPELTAERFIPNPFGESPGARLYRSGDLARYRPDGSLEYVGRLDDQVKLRGFRVELGEIEAGLTQHPAVREAVVLAREDIPGDKRLVAYLVTRAESAPSAGDLRRFLKTKLPDYMVPAAFVRLDALPLTPHGKVDRKALPSPDPGRPELEVAFVAPRTPVEEALARIWREVLGVPQVGIHDGFFDLGGHSLLAVQVMSRVRDVLHVDVPLRSLFEDPTVAELAVRVTQHQVAQVGPDELERLLADVEERPADSA